MSGLFDRMPAALDSPLTQETDLSESAFRRDGLVFFSVNGLQREGRIPGQQDRAELAPEANDQSRFSMIDADQRGQVSALRKANAGERQPAGIFQAQKPVEPASGEVLIDEIFL